MIVATGTLLGTVAGLAAPPVGTLLGSVTGGGGTGTLLGTVSTTALERYISRSLYVASRVVLAGVDVTAAVAGPVRHTIRRGDPLRELELTLVGREYLPTITATTWTRNAIEVYLRRGPAGAVTEHLEFAGYVHTCDLGGATGQDVRLTCYDLGYGWTDRKVCLEVAPFSAITVGSLCRSICSAVGLTATDIPDGSTWTKPFQSDGAELAPLLAAVGEPEGWSWRFDNSGTLVATEHRIKLPPEAADHRITLADLYAPPRIVPPTGVPSRWLLRADGAVSITEAGEEVARTVTTIEADYARKIAQQQQLSNGTVNNLSNSEIERFEKISRVTDEVTTRAGKPIRQVTIEEGWYNARAGKWETSIGGGGSAPGGYDYRTVYLDRDGEYTADFSEKFREVGRREQRWSYDAEGNLATLTVHEHTWFRRTAGVHKVSDTPGSFSVAGVLVGGDDISYSDIGADPGAIERYGLSAIYVTTYEYDPVSGAVARELQDVDTYYSARCSIDAVNDHYIRSDGEGQVDIVANRQLTGRQVRTNLLDISGRLAGVIDLRSAFAAPTSVSGDNDWGGGTFSYLTDEDFRLVERENVAYAVIDDNSYTKTEYRPGAPAQETRHVGRPPLPRYLTSPWLELRQEPIEVVIDDPVLEAFFGLHVRVLQHPYVQSSGQALALLRRLIAGETAYQVELELPPLFATEGQTLELVDPARGLHHRMLLIEQVLESGGAPPVDRATYVLEAPLV